MTTKNLKNLPDAFSLYMMGGDLNGHCKTCGAISTIEYRGLDPIYPDFYVICNQCQTYVPMKIRMMPKYITPQPYRGRRLFEKWQIKYGWWSNVCL
jgi:hypothetical protein